MDKPALLPGELDHYISQAGAEESLLYLLVKNTKDFASFFHYACADEVWNSKYATFMKMAIEWLTHQFYIEKITEELAVATSQSIRSHYAILKRYIPTNITLQLKDTTIQINSLLLASSSPIFHTKIRRECLEKSKLTMNLAEYEYQSFFRYIEEYVLEGEIKDLWKFDEELLFKILEFSLKYELVELSENTEKMLHKYINKQTVFRLLEKAHEGVLTILKSDCLAFLNSLESGVQFRVVNSNGFECHFYHFSENASDIFEQVCRYVTHFVCADNLISSPEFLQFIRQCPRLISINVAHSSEFSQDFSGFPASLQELNIAACTWLSDQHLRKIVVACPNLVRIVMGSNVQITALGWGALQKLHVLRSVDLSRCQQITDADLRVILHACAGVAELSLADCRQIGDRGFSDLSRNVPRLTHLNLSHTSISDGALVEIMTRCKNLVHLNLTRCGNITDKGVREIGKIPNNLKELVLVNCNVADTTLQELAKARPYLKVEIANTPNTVY